MIKLLKLVRQWLQDYEDDVTFIHRTLYKEHKKG